MNDQKVKAKPYRRKATVENELGIKVQQWNNQHEQSTG